MGSGRIDGRQEGSVCEILQELAVAERALWHRSPVIPATLTLGPGTAAEEK